MATRKPPKPVHYHVCGNGTCRYCGGIILNRIGKINQRASWHQDCVRRYRLVHFPRDTRRAVWNRDEGVCYMCGIQLDKKSWELEHIKPLYEAEGRIEYWELPNLGTSCKPCHKEKTKREAKARAEKRRIDKLNSVQDGSDIPDKP